MSPFRVESNRDGSSLVIDRTSRPDYNRAELSCGATRAAVEFYGRDVPSLSDLFGELLTIGVAGKASGSGGRLMVSSASVPPTTSSGPSRSPSGSEATSTSRASGTSSGPRRLCCCSTLDDWTRSRARWPSSPSRRIAAALIGGCRNNNRGCESVTSAPGRVPSRRGQRWRRLEKTS